MSKYYIWSVDNKGRVFLLSSWSSSWNSLNSTVSNIKNFKLIAATSWCVWAIGIDNELYIYIPKSDVVIRTPETIIENQRKVSGTFSSKHLLNSDPFEFTTPNYYGKLMKTDLRSFNLPSSRWKWESDWTVKLKFDDQLTNEGWIYSSNFLRKFQVERHFLTSTVRRRYWKRFRYFHAFDRWLYIAQDSEPFQISCSQDCCSGVEMADECFDLNSSGILDVGCGGEMLPHQKDGFLSVWIANANGQILFRLNVHRQNPEGSYWCHVKLPKFVKAISVAVGPLGSLLVCSSIGEIYFRESITWKNPIGTSWKSLELPHDLWEKEKIVQLSMSVFSIWARSSLGRLWSRVNVNLHETVTKAALGDRWNLVATDVLHISASASGQLFALPSKGEHILYKSAKSKNALGKLCWSGKLVWNFLEPEDSPITNLISVSSSGLFLEDDILPISWIPSPLTSHKIYQKKSNSHSDWKIKIVQSLKNRDKSEFKNPAFSNYTSPFEQTFWSKASDCQIRCFSSIINRQIWLPASVVLHHKIRNNVTCSTLHVKARHTQMFSIDCVPFFIESNEVSCISKYNEHLNRSRSFASCSTMIIVVKSKGLPSLKPNTDISPMLLRFSSENEIEDWVMAVNFVAFNQKSYSDKSFYGKAWILNKFQEPFSSPINKFHDAFNTWQQDGGHFHIVKSGAKGCITWALGFNGITWAHTPGWGGSYLGSMCSSKENLYPVYDARSITVVEYQKSKLLVTDMSRIFEPYMWTDEFGNIIPNKEIVEPLSKRWQWSDEWTVCVNNTPANSQSDGWQYATGINDKFEDNLTWNKNIRCRKWSRTYTTSTRGPWKEIRNNTLKIIDVAIYPGFQYEDEKNHLVLGITRKNKLFTRKGVSTSNPEGMSWSPIRSELKMLSIHINVNGTIWVVCTSGFIWRLKLPNLRDVTRINERDWEKIEHSSHGGKFKEIASSDNLTLWAIDSNDQLWVRAFDGNIYTASVGTHWIHVCNDVVHVSCGSERLVWAVFADGTLAERIGITTALPQGVSWDSKLTGIVTNVSLHGA